MQENHEQEPQGSGDRLQQLNATIAKRQRLLLGAGAAVILGAGSWWIMGGEDGADGVDPDAPKTIETGGLVNRELSQREFVARFENRMGRQDSELERIEKAARVPDEETREELARLRAENEETMADGQRVIDAYQQENAVLREQLNAAASAPPPAPAPSRGGREGSQFPVTSSDPMEPMLDAPPTPEVMVFSFVDADAATNIISAIAPATPPLVVSDSPDYLPPNSYAPARVIVGVDASASVSSQSDPLPVVLRITGPARSVVSGGRLLTTRLEGCLVNGAARGDLSSEKVYVKLAKMTCDQPGGRVAVSEVKGFLSFGGKTGVRGRVISREGSLVSQALLAGVIGGFGRGFRANADNVFAGGGLLGGGDDEGLSTADILKGGLGQGVGEAADTVSSYLIERAEQYQPVIEMPTGIDVDIVFLDGVYVRKN
ncbi:MAG: TrbI/VirB10 family protein [Pacificimonas sp.]